MRFVSIAVLLVLGVASAEAQTTETPVAFDTAGRVQSVTPALVSRLGLTAPVWPVSGVFNEARLYRISSGGYVISVQRTTGQTERYPLTDDQAAQLRAAFTEATERVGRVVMEEAESVISEPARGPFVRDQMLLAGIFYGPALASLTDDASLGTGVYLLATGGTFFALTEMAKTRVITKAQNSMATDGAARGWAALAGSLYVLGLDTVTDNTAALTILAGGIGGSIVGFNRGRNLSNSEAEASMTLSTLAAGTALGLTGIVVGEDGDEKGKVYVASALLGGIGGYALGPRYPRRAGYSVTAGDISLVRLGSLLGVMTIFAPLAEMDDMSPRAGAGLFTAGWVGGAIVADRIAARPYNHSMNDSWMIHLGALGGGLMGIALPVLAEAENATIYTTLGTAGAIAGAFLAQSMIAPPKAGSPIGGTSRSGSGLSRLQFDPMGLAMAAAGQKGNHSVLRIRF